jgi:putative transposase
MFPKSLIGYFPKSVIESAEIRNMEADFCVETLERVLTHSRCDIFNTDQGSQFTSKDFIDVLNEHHVDISMDGKGRWADNIFVERLWRSVKYECVYLQEWGSVIAIREALREYFRFYNDERPHQSLAGLTPRVVYGNLLH